MLTRNKGTVPLLLPPESPKENVNAQASVPTEQPYQTLADMITRSPAAELPSAETLISKVLKVVFMSILSYLFVSV